ncbi:hypothetical protein HY612_04980 [Candidatus Roizmanbacteria bacterium]|nr:hypothetical protein [Candidatus Roizmanbacteria bacterium]
MLTIICGEDTVASRNYYTALQQQYKNKGYEISNIVFSDIEKIDKWLGESVSLFSQKKVFFTANISKKIRQDNKTLLNELEKIAKMKDIELIDWEEVSKWELKLKKLGLIKEFKPDQTIFKLLDSLWPSNRIVFISLLDKLSTNLDENFIFIMLVRYVRNLILVKEGVNPTTIQPWQLFKLKKQASLWKIANLINFYEALFKIDLGLKTSTNPFSIKDSLEILACHFL